MKKIDKSKPVLVTGATGYVAGHIVKKLLEEGISVHAAVRDPENKDKLKYLNALADELRGEIKYFKSDLLVPGSYDEAVNDCELVFHTASPFTISVDDPKKDLIDPALKGTQNVLDSVNKTDTVKRVVLTSSVAAIIGDTKDLLEYPDGTATEEHWNTSSSLEHQAYSYSKTVAEREAWKISETSDSWDLVVINPTLVLGPGISPQISSESFRIMKQLGDGSMKTGAPGLDFGIADVRDVADAHIKAAFTPEAEGRHIVSADHRTLLQMAQILRDKFGDKYAFPKKVMPKWLVWLMAPAVGVSRKMIARNVGYPWLVDNTKSKEKLQINYRPVEETLTDFFRQLIDAGTFE